MAAMIIFTIHVLVKGFAVELAAFSVRSLAYKVSGCSAFRDMFEQGWFWTELITRRCDERFAYIRLIN